MKTKEKVRYAWLLSFGVYKVFYRIIRISEKRGPVWSAFIALRLWIVALYRVSVMVARACGRGVQDS